MFCLLGIEHRQTDWKTFLVNKLVGAKTLPDSFRQKVREYFIE
jgi:predicted ATP-grasp superfamily ATP-dependent carboligase